MSFCQQMASLAEVCSITTCVTSELGKEEENETKGPCPKPLLLQCPLHGDCPAFFKRPFFWKAFVAPPRWMNTSPLLHLVFGAATLTSQFDLLICLPPSATGIGVWQVPGPGGSDLNVNCCLGTCCVGHAGLNFSTLALGLQAGISLC